MSAAPSEVAIGQDRPIAGVASASLKRELCVFAGLLAWVALTRAPYVVDFPLLSKDGPLYVRSLALGRDYCVPMPGNLGFVLLAKLARRIWSEPVAAFSAVNVLLTSIGAYYTWRIVAWVVSAPLALLTAVALTCNPSVWWHGATINSYLVWLAVLPAIGFHGGRYVRGRKREDLLGMSIALGIGTALRQDLLMFGVPLWAGCLAFAHARWRDCLVAAAIVAVCCLIWFTATSAILGGPGEYLARVRIKHAGHMEGFSVEHQGLFEGLVRNGSKYALFLLWSVPLVGPAAVVGLATIRLAQWRWVVLAVLWVAPSMWFSLYVFAGNAGLIFPVLPILYLLAAWGLNRFFASDGPTYAAVTMALLALASTVQFTRAPILPETNQRNVILNVTFFRYSGPGLLGRFEMNLDDYGIDPSLKSVVRQLRRPEPVPGRPRPERFTMGPSA